MTQVTQVGYGEADITPQVGLPLSGFIFRENAPSTHIDLPLAVRVLALQAGGTLCCLINLEVLGICAALQEQILTRIENLAGIGLTPDRVVMVATHTHSAPATSPLEGEAEPDAHYWQMICDRTAEACLAAFRTIRPAILSMASLRLPGFTYNRRAVLNDGRVSMALVPDAPVLERGPVDDALTALVWEDASGDRIAALLHYACHGVAVCTQGISGDAPGEVSRLAGDVLNTPCLFLQGAAGDINPTTGVGDYVQMQHWGESLVSVLQSLPAQLQRIPAHDLSTRSMTLLLDYEPLPDHASVARTIRDLEQIAAGDVDSPELANTLRELGNLMNFKPGERPDAAKAAFCSAAIASALRRTMAVVVSGQPLAPYPVRITLWQTGPIVLVFIPAELFALTGYRIRALGRGHALLPVTYAAPIAGYIPDADAMAKGGYEVDDAWKFYRQPAPFHENSVDRIVQAVAELYATFSRH